MPMIFDGVDSFRVSTSSRSLSIWAILSGRDANRNLCVWYRVVPENVQKKQARDAKLLKELKERRDNEKKQRVEKRKTLVANAEKYYKEYQTQQ